MSDVKKVKKQKDIKVAFIADEIKALNEFGINHNTTFELMISASKFSKNKNLQLLLTESDKIKIRNGEVYGEFSLVTPQRTLGKHLIIHERKEYDLSSLDVIFVRKDPPVDQNYISLIQTLCLIPRKTLIINSPEGILKANEKLYALNFKKFLPPTLVTHNKKELLDFLREHNEVVIKPLFHKGGIGVFYLKSNDRNSISIIEKSLKSNSVLMIQKYLPYVKHGDKRILLLNGEILGGILRVPQKGEFRAHISRGARYKKLRLSRRDLEICKKLKPYLQRDGLYFVGIDLIGDYLIEINVTCPANLREAGECHGKPLAEKIIKWACYETSGRF